MANLTPKIQVELRDDDAMWLLNVLSAMQHDRGERVVRVLMRALDNRLYPEPEPLKSICHNCDSRGHCIYEKNLF